MTQPLISLLHATARVKPSKGFPRGWRAAFDDFLAKADHPERIEYIISVHESRRAEFWENTYAPDFDGTFQRVDVVINTFRDCVVDQCNVAGAASTGKLLFGVMDDLEAPEHWDTLLLDAVPTIAKTGGALDLDGEYILQLGSGSPSDKDLIVVGACTRKRYERYGYILNPAFESMYSDNYATWLAREDQKKGVCKIIERLDIVFQHNHPIFGRGEPDEIYALQNRPEAYRQGEATFSKLVYGTRVLAVCLPGDKFDRFWGAAQFALLTYLNQGMRFNIGHHWCYTSNVYCTRIELAESVLTASPKADLVLWIDDDNTLSPQNCELLIQDLDEHPELDGVVGWCWCDNDGDTGKPWMMSCGRQGGEDLKCLLFTLEDFRRSAETGKCLIGSDDVAPDAFWSGFPCVLMRASVLEKLGALAFAPMVRPDVKYGFTSEDTSFFRHAFEQGLKFAVDIRVKVPHAKLRAIEPQYVPESERAAAMSQQGKMAGMRLVRAADAAD